MGFGDDTRERLGSLLSIGAVGTGVAISGKRAWPELKGALSGITQFPRAMASTLPPYTSGVARVVDSARFLEEFQDAAKTGIAVMGQEGWREAVSQAVHASLLGRGRASKAEISEIMNAMRQTDPNELVTLIRGLESKTGGLDKVYENLRSLTGGRTLGHGGKTASTLISELGGVLEKSAFSPGGRYWRDFLNFGGKAMDVVPPELVGLRSFGTMLPEGALGPEVHAQRLQEQLKVLGVDASVTPGVRDLGARKTVWHTGRGYLFGRRSVEGKDLILPYSELQIRVGKQTAYVPLNYSVGGLIPYGSGRLSTASVPRFTMQEASGKLSMVDFNGFMSMSLHGEEGKFDNLATMIYKGLQEKKGAREVVEFYNQQVRSQVREITIVPHARAGSWTSTGTVSAAGARVGAMVHQISVSPIERLFGSTMTDISGSPFNVTGKLSGREYAEYAKLIDLSFGEAGMGAFPLGSPGSTSTSMRMMLKPLHERWDMFGASFPFERRFLQNIKDFEPTEAAVRAMENSPLAGVIPRGMPISATKEYSREVAGAGYKLPNVLMAYALEDAKYLRNEEIMVSRALADMMEVQTLKPYTIHTPFGGPKKGTILAPGQPIGISVKTGKMIHAAGSPGQMIEEVVDVETSGDISRLVIARRFPLQEQGKTFTQKATTRIEDRLWAGYQREYGTASSFFKTFYPQGQQGAQAIEAIGSASLIRKNPALVRRQMLGATLVYGAERYQALKASGVQVPGTMEKAFAGGVYAEEGRDFIARLMAAGRGPYGAEKQILALGKEWGLSSEQLGLVGSVFNKRLAGEVDAGRLSAEKFASIYQAARLSAEDIKAIETTKFAVGAPEFAFGDFPTLDKPRRGSIEPRGIRSLLFQNWTTKDGTPIGKMISEEIERRRIPGQVFDDIEGALRSVVSTYVPGDLPEYGAARAIEAMKEGGEDFIMRLPKGAAGLGESGGKIFVPSRARLMDWFIPEIGEEMPQTLLASYLKVANSAKMLEDGKAGAFESLETASKGLRDSLYKQWLLSTQPRGEIAGSAMPVAQSWIGRSQVYDSVEDFVRSSRAFQVGIGKQTAQKMFDDLLRQAPESERAAIRNEMKIVMGGTSAHPAMPGYGVTFRHPLVYPYSTIPAEFHVLDDYKTGVFFQKAVLRHKGKEIDLSGMLGMAMDVDMDMPVTMFVADQKTKAALHKTITDPKFRREFAQAAILQSEMEDVSAKAMGLKLTEGDKIEQLRRLIGVEIATPDVSVAAQRLAVAAGEAGTIEERLLITALEQRAISSKHGGEAERIAKSIDRFVSGAGGPRARKREFEIAWNAIWGTETFEAGGKTFDMNQYYEILSQRLSDAEASGKMETYNKVTRQAARAHRGLAVEAGSAQEVLRSIEMNEASLGAPEARLVRQMRKGPPSGAEMTRKGIAETVSRLKAAGNIAKRHAAPAGIGLAAAIGLRYALGSSSLDMPEARHEHKATELGMGSGTAEVPPPMPYANRIVTNAGGTSPAGYDINIRGDFSTGMQNSFRGFLNTVASGGQAVNVRMTDDRGAITPQYINKMMEERYW